MIPCGIETGLVVPGPNALARLSVAAVSVHDRRSIAPSKNSLASAPQLRQTLQSQRPAKLAERQPGLETSHTPQNGVGYQPEDEAEEYRPCLDWHNVVVWQSKNLAPISSRAEPCSLRDGCTAVPGRATGSVRAGWRLLPRTWPRKWPIQTCRHWPQGLLQWGRDLSIAEI